MLVIFVAVLAALVAFVFLRAALLPLAIILVALWWWSAHVSGDPYGRTSAEVAATTRVRP